jgi:ADP-heptose:LPS heptosyltransferase
VNDGLEISIVAGPYDSLPEALNEHEVVRLTDKALVHEMKQCDFVITNDSSPAHIAGLLNIPCFCLGRVNNLAYWIPPNVIPLGSDKMPIGYGPYKYKHTNKILDGWLSPENIYMIIVGFLLSS